jgi:hypothetical protein
VTPVEIARFANEGVEDLLAGFRNDGAVVFDGLPERIGELLATLALAYPACFGCLGPEIDSMEIGNRRSTFGITFGAPLDCTDILFHPAVNGFFSTLGGDFVFEASGVISSFAGAEETRMHADNVQLLKRSGFNAVLPTWAVNFVCPSGPNDALRGTTALWPSSQQANEKPYAAAFVAPEVLPGCCALWDFRTWYEGLEKRSDEARPLLYAVASRSLWTYHEDCQLGVDDMLFINAEALDGPDKLARNRFVRAKVVQWQC